MKIGWWNVLKVDYLVVDDGIDVLKSVLVWFFVIDPSLHYSCCLVNRLMEGWWGEVDHNWYMMKERKKRYDRFDVDYCCYCMVIGRVIVIEQWWLLNLLLPCQSTQRNPIICKEENQCKMLFLHLSISVPHSHHRLSRPYRQFLPDSYSKEHEGAAEQRNDWW